MSGPEPSEGVTVVGNARFRLAQTWDSAAAPNLGFCVLGRPVFPKNAKKP